MLLLPRYYVYIIIIIIGGMAIDIVTCFEHSQFDISIFFGSAVKGHWKEICFQSFQLDAKLNLNRICIQFERVLDEN